MNREQKRRRFNEALVNMLYPQPPPSPPPEEEEEKPVKLLEEEFAVDLSSDELERSSCSASDVNDDSESGTQKLTRAQRKRLRKKKLKEDASRRGKMIGPLLPSTKEVGDDDCTGGVRQNAAENVDATSDKSDYVERKVASLGLEMLFLLTTLTADWFVRRGFSECSFESITEKKRRKINLSRKSKYYMKKLVPNTSGITVDRAVI